MRMQLTRIGLALALACAGFAQQNLSSPTTVLNSSAAAGELRWRDSGGSGHYVALSGPTGSLTGNVHLTWPAAQTDKSLIYDRSGVLFASDSNLVWDYGPQVLRVTGVGGTASMLSLAGYVQSDGGFVSAANSWEGINSNTDGALLRAYAVGPNVANNAGGYMAYADMFYPPTGTFTIGAFSTPTGCYDAYGNLASQPVPLTGLSQFTFNTVFPGLIEGDALLWNGPSPLQAYTGAYAPNTAPFPASTTPCATAYPVVNYNGINTNSYIFARSGFASDNPQFNAITLFTGGAELQSITTVGYYAPGTSTTGGTLGVPGFLGGYMQFGHSAGTVGGTSGTCASIGSCANPLTGNNGVIQGTAYYDDSLQCLNLYASDMYNAPTFVSGFLNPGAYNIGLFSLTHWNCLAQFNHDATFLTVESGVAGSTYAFKTTNTNFLVDGNGNLTLAGSGSLLQVTGSAGGVDVTTQTAYNAIQCPNCGVYAKSFTGLNYIQPGTYGTHGSGTPTLASGPTATSGDSFHAGASSYYLGNNGGGPCLALYDGTTWACSSSGSGGVPSITGTASQILVNGGTTPVTTAATLTLPSTVVTAEFASSAIGASLGFALNNSNFLVDANGNLTLAGSGSVLAIAGATGGVDVTTDTAYNSIQTVGGFSGLNVALNTTTHNAPLEFDNGFYTAPFGGSYGQFKVILYDGAYAGSGVTGSYGLGVESYNMGFASYGGYKFYQAAGTTPLMVVGGQGTATGGAPGNSTKVGIGTASPAFQLDVQGGQVNSSGGYCIGGVCTTTLVYSLTGTANEIFVNGTSGSAQTGALTLTIPQPIATTSNVTFGSVTTGSNTVTGPVVAWACGTAVVTGCTGSPTIAFQVDRLGSGGGITPIQMDGAGNLSIANTLNVNGTQVIDASRNGSLSTLTISGTASNAIDLTGTGGGITFASTGSIVMPSGLINISNCPGCGLLVTATSSQEAAVTGHILLLQDASANIVFSASNSPTGIKMTLLPTSSGGSAVCVDGSGNLYKGTPGC